MGRRGRRKERKEEGEKGGRGKRRRGEKEEGKGGFRRERRGKRGRMKFYSKTLIFFVFQTLVRTNLKSLLLLRCEGQSSLVYCG